MLLGGSDDLISYYLNVPIIMLVWFLRVGFFVFPVAAFFVTRHVCRAMQRSDRRKLRTGTVYGIAAEPSRGAFTAVSRPVPEEQRVIMEAHRPEQLIAPIPRHLVPLPRPAGSGPKSGPGSTASTPWTGSKPASVRERRN